jgi:hypothetical protein
VFEGAGGIRAFGFQSRVSVAADILHKRQARSVDAGRCALRVRVTPIRSREEWHTARERTTRAVREPAAVSWGSPWCVRSVEFGLPWCVRFAEVCFAVVCSLRRGLFCRGLFASRRFALPWFVRFARVSPSWGVCWLPSYLEEHGAGREQLAEPPRSAVTRSGEETSSLRAASFLTLPSRPEQPSPSTSTTYL